jgi:hypothetical protein
MNLFFDKSLFVVCPYRGRLNFLTGVLKMLTAPVNQRKKYFGIFMCLLITASSLWAQGYEKAKVYLVRQGFTPGQSGSFWDGMQGTKVSLHPWTGGPQDANGTFYLAADAANLYMRAVVSDASPQENKKTMSNAWNATSIEFFFGTNTSAHRNYASTDKRVRLFGKDKNDPNNVAVGINDKALKADQYKAYITWQEKGYIIEAALPLSLFGISALTDKQPVRCEFRINHAKPNAARSVIVNWRTPTDDAHQNPSVWSDGEVVAK